jgi:hypothetical protein
MKPTELAEQIDIEIEAIQLTIDELESLRKDVSGREATVRESAAAGLFLANFYNGIEKFRLRWPDMLPGVEGAGDVFVRFKAAVESHLREIQL